MRSFLVATVVGGLAVSGAVARNVINEHSGYYQEDIHYSIVTVGENDIAVLIHKDSVQSIPWKFEAYDDVTHEAGFINDIRIEPTGPVGMIRLNIIGDPSAGHEYGAADVKRIDLVRYADVQTNTVENMHITADFGANGVLWAHNAGTLTIGGDVLDWIDIVYEISGPVTIGGDLRDDITCEWLSADLTVNGPGPHTGRIFIFVGDYSHSMFINGSSSGLIELWGDLAGRIQIATDNRGICLIRAAGRTRRMYMGVPTGRRA